MKYSVLFLVLLTGCGVIRQQELGAAYQKAEQAEANCEARKRSGTIKTWSGLSDCYQNEVYPIYASNNYPNMDLVDLAFAKYIEINERIASKKITPAQGGVLKKQVKAEINQVFIQRNVSAAQMQAQNTQATGALLSGLAASQQANQPRQPVHCTSTRMGNFGDMNCY